MFGLVKRRGELRDAYVPNLRVRLASDVASLCAAAVLVGLLGTALTWWDRSALFDLAASSSEVVKMGTGYLAGPVAILVALPLIFGLPGQVALKRWFKRRLVLAAVLWLLGLAILVERVAGLDGYKLEAGTFVTGGLILVGLLATLAMWPHDLTQVHVNASGRIRPVDRRQASPRETA
jgi:hypothetical protein